ncbi:MAG: adenylate/guanylate cyclase domain-containing protein, partial [Xanthobacteraceae bacterium]|nr:adenylate/guanylate cyclase domain-containing protein [Xanthobacteraceae bacterium]
DKFAIMELDFITVKGKKEPEVIYAIAGREDMAKSSRFQHIRNLGIEMLTCYRNRDWDGALLAIEKARAADDTHRFRLLYDLYFERIKAFQETPPPADWDGVFALTTK